MTRARWTDGGAVLSPCGTYRYLLHRVWDPSRPRLLWVMLNPSTADGGQDDPTIRKCQGFSARWGYGSLEVVNLFPWRATSPADLVRAHRGGRDVHGGRAAQEAVVDAVARSSSVCAAWGAHPLAGEVCREVVRPLRQRRRLLCIGTTQDGHPRHPLMAAYTHAPRVFLEREPPPYDPSVEELVLTVDGVLVPQLLLPGLVAGP